MSAVDEKDEMTLESLAEQHGAPAGCRFHTRCPYAIDACKVTVPQLVEIKPSHFAACIRINSEHPDIDANAAEGLGNIQQENGRSEERPQPVKPTNEKDN